MAEHISPTWISTAIAFRHFHCYIVNTLHFEVFVGCLDAFLLDYHQCLDYTGHCSSRETLPSFLDYHKTASIFGVSTGGLEATTGYGERKTTAWNHSSSLKKKAPNRRSSPRFQRHEFLQYVIIYELTNKPLEHTPPVISEDSLHNHLGICSEGLLVRSWK